MGRRSCVLNASIDSPDCDTLPTRRSSDLVETGRIKGGTILGSDKLRFSSTYNNVLDGVTVNNGLDLTTGRKSLRLHTSQTMTATSDTGSKNKDARMLFVGDQTFYAGSLVS